MHRFAITTLGCKANQYDSAALAATLETAGLRPAGTAPGGDAETAPDLVVINTCCVTATAMRKSRNAIRRAARRAPRAAVLVAGCYGDYARKRIADLLASLGLTRQRAFIAGHHGDVARRVMEIAHLLGSGPSARGNSRDGGCDPTAWQDGQDDLSMSDGPEGGKRTGLDLCIKARRMGAVKRNAMGTRGLAQLSQFPGHQRAFVKVQDGCDAFCAYCVVPYTRPVVWWRPVEQVQRECRRLVASGHKEIVLSGVFLGAYGRATAIRREWDRGPSLLPDLVRRIAAIEGLWRVRLSSLEPLDADDRLLDACAAMPNFAPHFHLPLQSGSARILRRMNRQYAPDDFRLAVERIRARFDRPAITTDIIVGFPGEDEDDFAATLEMARWAGFSKIHAFGFSPIEGTAAWQFRRQSPPPAAVKDRMAALARLESDMAAGYARQFVGQRVEALVEAAKARQPALRQAMTDRYLTVLFRGQRAAPGDIVHLRITGQDSDGLRGKVAGPDVAANDP